MIIQFDKEMATCEGYELHVPHCGVCDKPVDSLKAYQPHPFSVDYYLEAKCHGATQRVTVRQEQIVHRKTYGSQEFIPDFFDKE